MDDEFDATGFEMVAGVGEGVVDAQGAWYRRLDEGGFAVYHRLFAYCDREYIGG